MTSPNPTQQPITWPPTVEQMRAWRHAPLTAHQIAALFSPPVLANRVKRFCQVHRIPSPITGGSGTSLMPGAIWPLSDEALGLLIELGLKDSRIAAICGVNSSTVHYARHRRDPSLKVRPANAFDADADVQLDDGTYMRLVRERNIAPPENLVFKPARMFTGTPPLRRSSVGCAAAMLLE